MAASSHPTVVAEQLECERQIVRAWAIVGPLLEAAADVRATAGVTLGGSSGHRL
jgi:hypothetical protein